VALLVLASFSAAMALANEGYWTINQSVGGGENAFGPKLNDDFAQDTVPYGSAIGCAGLRGVGNVCSKNTKEDAVYDTYPFGYDTEPYIHNHLTKTGNFDGYTLWE
jgi:hypothetical protein